MDSERVRSAESESAASRWLLRRFNGGPFNATVGLCMASALGYGPGRQLEAAQVARFRVFKFADAGPWQGWRCSSLAGWARRRQPAWQSGHCAAPALRMSPSPGLPASRGPSSGAPSSNKPRRAPGTTAPRARPSRASGAGVESPVADLLNGPTRTVTLP